MQAISTQGLALAPPPGRLSPHELWTAWKLEPSIIIPLALIVVIYIWGTQRAWRRAGRGRSITRAQSMRFAGAIVSLAAALLSPLDEMSSNLFAAHMAQHQMLILISAPLLATSGFLLAFMWAMPRAWAQALAQCWNKSRLLPTAWQAISNPACAWLWFALASWVWHASTLYQLALGNETVHTWEHLSFLLTAVLFWWVLFEHSAPDQLRYGMAIAYLFTSSLQSALLAALMTFSPRPWYSYYAARAPAWGLSALQDQQLAGLIMWFPGSLVFTLLTIGYFAAWLRALEDRHAGLRVQASHNDDRK